MNLSGDRGTLTFKRFVQQSRCAIAYAYFMKARTTNELRKIFPAAFRGISSLPSAVVHAMAAPSTAFWGNDERARAPGGGTSARLG
jgi:hypothetical protein